MYSDRWSPGLRQGDIFGEIPFPLLKGKETWGFSGGFALTGSEKPTQVTIPTPYRWAMVVSHDCEFNEDKRTHFVVARIDAINPRTTDEELAELNAANDYAKAVEEGIPVPLDTFYLEPVDGAFDRPMRGNFACLASLPMDFSATALTLKRAELLHPNRIMLRGRLGVFFGRIADDLPDEEKRPRPLTTREEPESSEANAPEELAAVEDNKDQDGDA